MKKSLLILILYICLIEKEKTDQPIKLEQFFQGIVILFDKFFVHVYQRKIKISKHNIIVALLKI
jgi:hypothetical protein